MCIDYTSLNKACLKDPFPFPQIDHIMNSTSSYDLLFFLDAYSGFHQIPMSSEDEEHIAFIIVYGLFCYISMPYDFKNALPTFVCAMHKTFRDLIRDLIEVYVDDIIIKIKSRASLLDNLVQVFDRLQSTRTKLNPDKCVFGVTAGKLLGFLVSYRGIKANPKNIRMVEAMRCPTCIKDVQKLTGCLAVLSWFISRLAECALPFFKLLRKSGPFVWTDEAEEVFEELKWYLTTSSVMVAPELGEPLLLYIAVTTEAVSMVLVAEQPKPPQPQETKEAFTNGLGSKDPEPARCHEVGVTVGSQLLEASLAPSRAQ
jgi:dsDNA-binding SOS-regulon protein